MHCTCTEAGILLDIFTPMREDFVSGFFCLRSGRKEDGVEHGCTCTEAGILLDIFTPMREDFV